MQASKDMDAPPVKPEAAAAVTVPQEKPEKATTKAAARPTTLLDVQEVEWITRELERLLAREQQSGEGAVGGDAGAAGRHRRKRARVSPAPAAHKGGFLADLLGRHAVSICSGDAVDQAPPPAPRGTEGAAESAAEASARWRRCRSSFTTF